MSLNQCKDLDQCDNLHESCNENEMFSKFLVQQVIFFLFYNIIKCLILDKTSKQLKNKTK